VLDRGSQLVHASGSALLASIEDALARDGLTLGLAPDAPPLGDTTLAAWLARGAPGSPDPWLDPADHLVAGFTARLASGADLEVRPSPRRAVGPDLLALFFGTNERAGTITSAHLRARGPVRVRPAATRIERDPPVNELERALVDRLLDAVRDVR
jgi:alkyldihydroxyacetonephosphate synthase